MGKKYASITLPQILLPAFQRKGRFLKIVWADPGHSGADSEQVWGILNDMGSRRVGDGFGSFGWVRDGSEADSGQVGNWLEAAGTTKKNALSLQGLETNSPPGNFFQRAAGA